jgi:hypothetical protein
MTNDQPAAGEPNPSHLTPEGRPGGVQEWVSIEDPTEERTWVFEVSFLLSSWECIYGRGCLGVLDEPTPELVQGCCSHGAHFSDEEDVAKVELTAARLRPDQWQFHAEGRRKGIIRRQGADVISRRVKGACIFLNRPEFPGGPGCALHRAALEADERPLDWKPEVCWQLPLRREDSESPTGKITSTVSQWDRRHWGEGGDDFHWWCTESPEAFLGKAPVYETMRDELVELAGQAVYDRLVDYLGDVRTRKGRNAPLGHPVEVAFGQTRKARRPGQRPAPVVLQS